MKSVIKHTEVMLLLGATSIILSLVAFAAISILYIVRKEFYEAKIQTLHQKLPSTSSLQDINRLSMYIGDPDNDDLSVFPEVWVPVEAEQNV